jgi:hypothetical protein
VAAHLGLCPRFGHRRSRAYFHGPVGRSPTRGGVSFGSLIGERQPSPFRGRLSQTREAAPSALRRRRSPRREAGVDPGRTQDFCLRVKAEVDRLRRARFQRRRYERPCVSLENRYTSSRRVEGSNPSPSADPSKSLHRRHFSIEDGARKRGPKRPRSAQFRRECGRVAQRADRTPIAQILVVEGLADALFVWRDPGRREPLVRRGCRVHAKCRLLKRRARGLAGKTTTEKDATRSGATVEKVVHCFVIPAEHPWPQGRVTTSFRVRRFRC